MNFYLRVILNRITLSIVLIVAATAVWEFFIKPETSPIYTEAVALYKNGRYEQSLALLKKIEELDPNDAATLSLMGWDYLKMGDAKNAEKKFERAHRLAPSALDLQLGYAYTEIALKNYEEAGRFLTTLANRKVDNADVHIAWAALYRAVGRNRDAVHEFQIALAKDKGNTTAMKNLQEIYSVTGDIREVSLEFAPLERGKELTLPARVEGEYFSWLEKGVWRPVYLTGVDLTAALPGHFPADSAMDEQLYADWLAKISNLGVNTIRVYSIMPAAFYRAFFRFNVASNRPLRLLQGIAFGSSPRDDLFNHEFFTACQKEIADTVDAIHGRADVGASPAHPGGIYTNNISHWVAGFIIGEPWPSHIVTDNNQLHPDMQSWKGDYLEVPSGSPTEIFLAQMINYTAEVEESKYNWQHPAAFANWPTLDSMRHPTESTILEEASLRRSLGERFPMPSPPYDDDDGVSLDPTHLHPTARFRAGYFAAYAVFPFYPDFLSRDTVYLQARDSEGQNPFFGYLQDLKAHHRGLPLVITDYGIPSSSGIGHFSPAGFDQGGKSEDEQGRLLSRFTHNIYDSGAAGGMVFEWLDEWFRETWLVRNFETPAERKPLWLNPMDPAEYFGLYAADPRGASSHRLGGDASEFANVEPIYREEGQAGQAVFQRAGDRYDAARDLRALYADADEAYLYLRLTVAKLDNDGDGQPDWKEANYLIGISTAPGQAGLTSLPFIAPLHFPMGMTYAIQLAGPQDGRLWIASSYNPYQIAGVEGLPTQTVLTQKLGWRPAVTDNGAFEPLQLEPNRRRFARDGKYFPPQRYDRGALRYASLDPKSSDYNTLAEWHANVKTNAIDLRIPWNLLNVTDPSRLKVFMGLEKDGTVRDADTRGFMFVAFSYRPLEAARARPMMEQGHPIADALPGMANATTVLARAYKEYRWAPWEQPQYHLRLKDSYSLLRKMILALPEEPLKSRQVAPPSPIAETQSTMNSGRGTSARR